MAVLTSTRTQNRVAAAARKVGGYGELVRLSRERFDAGEGAVLVRAADGRWTYRKSYPAT